MPGSIKIDDGSGNYTILTNAGSLGSDKTITIPNETATLATTNGITEIDTWALTATVNSNGDITSNLARYNGTNSGYKGTGMTQSSGVFTFPSTGFWQISCGIHGQVGSDDGAGIAVKATDNNSSYSVIGYVYMGGTGSDIYFGYDNSFIIDVTDTANDKVKFAGDGFSAANVYGSADGKLTQFRFVRLGDT